MATRLDPHDSFSVLGTLGLKAGAIEFFEEERNAYTGPKAALEFDDKVVRAEVRIAAKDDDDAKRVLGAIASAGEEGVYAANGIDSHGRYVRLAVGYDRKPGAGITENRRDNPELSKLARILNKTYDKLGKEPLGKRIEGWILSGLAEYGKTAEQAGWNGAIHGRYGPRF